MFTDYLSWVYYVSATVLRRNWRFNGELKQVKISMSLKKKYGLGFLNKDGKSD